MLLNLHVKNLALIEDIDICFEEGLNILSGETGAGKSIILGAVNIALGEKTGRDIIRTGAQYGLVELTFSVNDNRVLKKMSDMDIYADNGEIIITRKIMLNARSIIKVNEETVPVSVLKKLSPLLINIHGQHDGELLLEKSRHCGLLDDYAENIPGEYKKNVKKLCDEYKKLTEMYAEFDMDEDARLREMSICEFQINEIEEAELKPGEDEELEKKVRLFADSQKIVSVLSEFYNLMGSEGILGTVGTEVRKIGTIADYDEKIKDMYDALMDMEAMCRDVSRNAQEYIESMSFDRETALKTEQRYNLINGLKAKYGGNIEAVMQFKDDCENQYDMLVNYSERKEELQRRIEAVKKEYNKEAEELTRKRKRAAGEFSEKLTEKLRELNFPDVKFSVDFKESDAISPTGRDIIEFMISTNVGEDVKPLIKIASGGELSRIMLALKSVMAGKDEIDTIIFDEIDTGISGRTAQKISEQMKLLSREHQLICITHLPQIAAMADSHFLIEKKVKNNKTVTEIEKLDYASSTGELARMIGGVSITENVLASAREMKELAKKWE